MKKALSMEDYMKKRILFVLIALLATGWSYAQSPSLIQFAGENYNFKEIKEKDDSKTYVYEAEPTQVNGETKSLGNINFIKYNQPKQESVEQKASEEIKAYKKLKELYPEKYGKLDFYLIQCDNGPLLLEMSIVGDDGTPCAITLIKYFQEGEVHLALPFRNLQQPYRRYIRAVCDVEMI